MPIDMRYNYADLVSLPPGQWDGSPRATLATYGINVYIRDDLGRLVLYDYLHFNYFEEPGWCSRRFPGLPGFCGLDRFWYDWQQKWNALQVGRD